MPQERLMISTENVSDELEWTESRPSDRYVKYRQQAISGALHICIMIWFEIYLFFWYIIPIEHHLIKTQISNYLKTMDGLYDQYVPEASQSILSEFVHENPFVLAELEKLHDAYVQGNRERMEMLVHLQYISFYMLSVAVGVLVVLLGMNTYILRKIDWGVIVSENVAMLVGLGCFQFLFFTQVALKYSPLSDTDVQYWCATHVYEKLS
jgi:hypothetical protein